MTGLQWATAIAGAMIAAAMAVMANWIKPRPEWLKRQWPIVAIFAGLVVVSVLLAALTSSDDLKVERGDTDAPSGGPMDSENTTANPESGGDFTSSDMVQVPVGRQPSDITEFGGNVYIAAEGVKGGRVTRIDASTGQRKASKDFAGYVYGLAAGAGAVWIMYKPGLLTRLHPTSLDEVESLPVPAANGNLAFGHGAMFIAWIERPFWGEDQSFVARVDVDVKKVAWTVDVLQSGVSVPSIDVSSDAVWVKSSSDPTAYTALNPKTGAWIAQFNVDCGHNWAVAGESVFVPCSSSYSENEIVRVDSKTGAELSRYPVYSPFDVVVLDDSLIVSQQTKDTLVRIDIQTGALSPEISTGDGPTDLLLTRDALWVVNFVAGTVSRYPLGQITGSR